MKRSFPLLMALLVLFSSSCKQKVQDKKSTGRLTADIPGAVAPPAPKGWVNDFDSLFTTAQATELDSLIHTFEKETGNEIAVVTIPANWVAPENFNEYVLALANEWEVGKKNNNGVVIGISNGLHKIRICNGYGIEKKITDAETKMILDSVVFPEFKENRLFEGTKMGMLALMKKIQ